jgi:lipopolysaccharide transport system permease protein
MNSLSHQFDLICHLSRRDFRLNYTGSVLGILWSVLLPLIQLLVFVFLFGRVVPLDIPDYPAFVFSALLPWTWFSNCVGSAGGLFTSNRDLLRRPNFSPITLIVVSMLSNLLSYLVSLPILIVVLSLYGRSVNIAMVVLPLLLLIQGILLVGIGLIIATMNVFYRDVQHLVRVGLSLLFYLVPVFYDPHRVGANFSGWLMANPVAVLIQSYREVFFYQRAPTWEALFFTTVISLIAGGLGYLTYHRQQSQVIDAL